MMCLGLCPETFAVMLPQFTNHTTSNIILDGVLDATKGQSGPTTLEPGKTFVPNIRPVWDGKIRIDYTITYENGTQIKVFDTSERCAFHMGLAFKIRAQQISGPEFEKLSGDLCVIGGPVKGFPVEVHLHPTEVKFNQIHKLF